MKTKDIKIKTDNPITADEILQQFGVLMAGGGKDDESSYHKDKDGNYEARVLSGDTDYVKFVIKNQGYNFIEIID